MIMKKLTSLLLITLILSVPGMAREEGGKTLRTLLYKANQTEGPDQTVININNFTVWVRGDGWHDWAVDGSWNGTFPKGTAGAIFSDGILWGSKVNDGGTVLVRVGGNTHSYGNLAGAILTDASGKVIGAEDPEDPAVRPYRVRPDFQTADLTDDAANFFLVPTEDVTASDIQVIYDQYEIDWLNWRWDKGAPYDDRDKSGAYEPDPDGDGVYGELEVDEATGDTTYVEDIPGIPGADQTLWTVYNDLDEGTVIGFYGSPPTGVELQETYWAYSLDNPLGNTVFKRFRIIYKGTTTTPSDAYLEDMYIAQWSDPDLGQYTDDYLGCDTTQSLGYVYNSSNSDAVWEAWGMAPPAAGYDFLQGPMLPGVAGEDRNKNNVDDAEDWAIFDLKPVGPGFINLPMTTFTFFAAGSPRSDPPGDYSGTLEWYNLMRGCEPDPGYPSCDPLYDEKGNVTHFELSGDPVLGTGDLDGKPTAANPMRFPPGDRRAVFSTGPFNMSLGDTQEVVIALVGASGKNFIQSVALLKFGDNFAQEAYDNLFDLPSGPPAPELRIIELDKELVLEWESNPEAVAATEGSDAKGYKFEGYNVYQLPSATAPKEDGVRLATFDLESAPSYIYQEVFDPDAGVPVLKPVQFGINSGIQRYMRITEDALTGGSLINGKTYYFAVTAYNQNMALDVSTHSLESPHTQSLKSGRPHAPNPQTIFPHSLGDTLEVVNVIGQNDSPVHPVIVDPEAPAGQEFEIHYEIGDDGTIYWSLLRVDVTPEDTLLSNVIAYNPYGTTPIGIDTTYRYPGEYGGFTLYVQDAPSGVKSVKEGGRNVLGTPNPSGEYYIYSSLTDLPGGAIDENNYELRFTANGSWALTGATYPTSYWVRVPFEAWDMGATESDTDDVQLFCFFHDAGEDSVWSTAWNEKVDGKYVFDRIEIAKVEYNENVDDVPSGEKVKIFLPKTYKPLQNINIVDLSGKGTAPSTGTTVRFDTYKAIKDGDIKKFTEGTFKTGDTGETPKKRVKKITVFPNPYMGLNKWETSRFEKYVTFSHLPRKAIIRIYTLAGVLVRTIEKNDETQFTRWNLNNDFDLPVASGIYIAHIEMPDIGEETVLKLAIIQEQQYLRSY